MTTGGWVGLGTFSEFSTFITPLSCGEGLDCTESLFCCICTIFTSSSAASGGLGRVAGTGKKKKKSNLTWKSQPLTPKRCRFDKRNTPGFGSLFPRQKGIKGEGGKESLKSKNHKAQSRKKKIPKIRISLHSPWLQTSPSAINQQLLEPPRNFKEHSPWIREYFKGKKKKKRWKTHFCLGVGRARPRNVPWCGGKHSCASGSLLAGSPSNRRSHSSFSEGKNHKSKLREFSLGPANSLGFPTGHRERGEMSLHRAASQWKYFRA